jgi:F0F1-type ATP synthase delta subunit
MTRTHGAPQVDPDIIGGVIVEIGGDKYIDMSTRTKVNKIVKELSAPI